jgi:hypothetical protein
MMQLFSQTLLVALPIILPHADNITTEASWICDHITSCISEIFHSSNVLPRKTPTQEQKQKYIYFDVVLGFCKSNRQISFLTHAR